MPYATMQDLAARFPRDLTAAEQNAAPTMLADASFLLNIQAPGLVEAVAADNMEVSTAAMLLTVAMVKRALETQAASSATTTPGVEQVSETWGPYSRSTRYRMGSNLYLDQRELDGLLALLWPDRSTAVSMRSPGL